MPLPSPDSPVATEATAPSAPTPVQSEIIWSALTLLAVLTICAGTAFIFFGFIQFLGWVYPVLLPVCLAILIALLLDPPVSFLCLSRLQLSRASATLVVFLGVVILCVLFLTFLLPSLLEQGSKFFQGLNHQMETVVSAINDRLRSLEPPPPPQPSTESLTLVPPVTPATPTPPAAPDWVKDNLNGLLQKAEGIVYNSLAPVGQAFGFLFGFGFVPIYAFYFLADRDRIVAGWHYFVPLRKEWRRDEVISVLNEIITSLIAYFRGQIVVACCNGFLTAVGLTVIGLPSGLFLGVMAGALSVVPFLGIIVSIVPCLLLAFTSAGTDAWWFKPGLVLVVFGAVQMIESLFISPRVQSHSTGLHPVVIILGILIWSSILPGLLGPILAVPLTSALVVLMRRYIWPIEETAIDAKEPSPA